MNELSMKVRNIIVVAIMALISFLILITIFITQNVLEFFNWTEIDIYKVIVLIFFVSISALFKICEALISYFRLDTLKY